MIETHVFITCILLAASATAIIIYFVEFLSFMRKHKRKEYVQNLNKTVEKILEHQNTDMSNMVIDITDYIELRPKVEPASDAYIEELANNQLIYMDDIKMWIKINKGAN
jgi:sensor domain CHASE-containing protein